MKSLLRVVPFLVLGFFGTVLAPCAEKKAAPPARDVVTVACDRADALYGRGDLVTFRIRASHDGTPIDGREIEWTITKDGVPPTRSGRTKLQQGEARVTASLDEPGFLQCRATYQADGAKITALAGAGISPLEIKPSAAAPLDFDAFWAAQKKALAGVPMNARLTEVKSKDERVQTFDLQADSIGAPVSGYFARPANAKPHTLPAILTVHGAGVNSASLAGPAAWAKDGALALDINAHGLPNGRDK